MGDWQNVAAQFAGLGLNLVFTEAPDAETQALLVSMIQSPEPSHTFGLLLWHFWNDLPPADNQTTVSVR